MAAEIFNLLHHPYYTLNLSIFKIYIPIIIFSGNGIPVNFEIPTFLKHGKKSDTKFWRKKSSIVAPNNHTPQLSSDLPSQKRKHNYNKIMMIFVLYGIGPQKFDVLQFYYGWYYFLLEMMLRGFLKFRCFWSTEKFPMRILEEKN